VNVDNELECRARKLLAYLDTEFAIEETLPFAVGFMVEKMRAAFFANAARTVAPAHRCRIYPHRGAWPKDVTFTSTSFNKSYGKKAQEGLYFPLCQSH
jgi:hypothetical protein